MLCGSVHLEPQDEPDGAHGPVFEIYTTKRLENVASFGQKR